MSRARLAAPALVGVVAVALSASLAGTAGATDRVSSDTAPRARPAWSSVPVGSIPAPPPHASAPERIPAEEQVRGLIVAREEAFARHRIRARVESSAARERCLVGDVDLGVDKDPSARGGSSSIGLRLGVVTAVRSERLVTRDDGASELEIADVWVDPRTLGARVASRVRVPLATIARVPAGLSVHAYRAQAGDELWAVVPTPQRAGSARGAEGVIGFADCGHLRVPAGGKSGGSAFVTVPLELGEAALGKGASPAWGQIQVSASVTQMSRDPAPVISVALAWVPDATFAPRR